jgi:hypothetical protein
LRYAGRNYFRDAKLQECLANRLLNRNGPPGLAHIVLVPGIAPHGFGSAPKEFEMRRLSLAIAGLFVFLVSTQAQAQTINFTAALSGGNENPGVVTGSVGTGTASINLATQVVTYRIDVYNMPVGVTASHFHVGAPGVNGPVVVNFTVVPNTSNDFSISGTASATDLTARAAQGINSWEDFVQALLLGNIYMNVHSTGNPGGEIRGQVVRVP